MKLREVVVEDANSATASNDYEQMQAFVRANRVQGVPPEQQIALALFKELQKQKQQNNRLSAELSDAEKRIDQATQSNDVQTQELGMHAAELERERKSGEEQKARVGQLGQTYAEREQASQDQIQDITAKLEAVKAMPGVNKDVAERLENQIRELAEKGMPAERVQELEQSIAQIQGLQVADDEMIKDLIGQVRDAHNTAAELEKTKQELSRSLDQAGKTAEEQIAQMQQQLAALNQLAGQLNTAINNTVPREIKNIDTRVDQLARKQEIQDKVNLMKISKKVSDALRSGMPPPPAPAPVPQPVPVAESRFTNAIRWATGKTK